MINHVTLEGRLGKDPEVQTFKGNETVVKFTLAYRETWKDRNTNEWKEKIYWFNVETRYNVNRLSQQLKKGDLVVLTGKVVVENWLNPETKVKSNFVKVVANNVNKVEIFKNGGAANTFNGDGPNDDLPF